MKDSNPVKDKSKAFAVRVINLYKHLCSTRQEYVMSEQLLRSGTSVGTNVTEAFVFRGQPKRDSKHYRRDIGKIAKGSLDKMELRGVEKAKTECAQRLFNSISTNSTRYGVVDKFENLYNIINGID